ncbi:unnamed protein product [Adineta ricciae]|uniref:G-protein coupled receptors family 1 profile domain-containing protein n=1 Tax=Adineta ricciae TaxID=249248 RepID=A0A813UML0_ADIRI|nr:unnamed protein product [Adineta ricciae]
MSTSSTSINFALINQSINRYVTVVLLTIGVIGNVLNLFIFTRKTFRNNICVIYFLAATVSDSFSIGIGLLTRLLNGYGVDPSQTSSIFCKFRFFITYAAAFTGGWFISLACIERYLCSSADVHQRRLVTVKKVYASISAVIVFGILAFGEQFYCIDINQQLFGAPQSCYQLKQNISCQIVDSLMQFLLEIISPTLIMIIFGCLLLRNVREKRRRINVSPSTNFSTPKMPLPAETNRSAQRREAQLLIILLIQVVVFIISTFPVSIYKFYSVATIYDSYKYRHTLCDHINIHPSFSPDEIK